MIHMYEGLTHNTCYNSELNSNSRYLDIPHLDRSDTQHHTAKQLKIQSWISDCSSQHHRSISDMSHHTAKQLKIDPRKRRQFSTSQHWTCTHMAKQLKIQSMQSSTSQLDRMHNQNGFGSYEDLLMSHNSGDCPRSRPQYCQTTKHNAAVINCNCQKRTTTECTPPHRRHKETSLVLQSLEQCTY